MTEASLNGFPSSQIAQKIQEDPYRFLVCADKLQTGYDEPRVLLYACVLGRFLGSGSIPYSIPNSEFESSESRWDEP